MSRLKTQNPLFKKEKYMMYLIIAGTLLITGCGIKTNERNSEKTTKEITKASPVIDELEGEAKEGQQTTQLEEASTKKEKNYLESYEETGQLPSLAKVYEAYFTVGVSLERVDIESLERRKLIAEQFNSITCGNEMKADFTLDREATLLQADEQHAVLNMERADILLQFAQENNLKMRGHTLVWHSQTPRWFFTVGYDNSEEAPFVSREVMLARMENYIKDQIGYVNAHYPDVIYAWDVVNEAIEVSDGHEEGIRMNNSYWYQVLGEDYVELAFEFAHKYAAPEQKLFYNDYGTYEKNKLLAIYHLAEGLKEKGIIDGIGMQSHIQISYPTISDYEYAIKKYGELGLEIHITELDIDAEDNSEETQANLATRYKRLIMELKMLKEKGLANITNVTLWGLTDDRSWLSNDGIPSWPLLFDADMKPKLAYFGMLQDDSIKLY